MNPHFISHQLNDEENTFVLSFCLFHLCKLKGMLPSCDEAFWSVLLYVSLSSELKERLKPELLELIRQQRLNRLCQGTMFRKISSRRRQGETAHTHTPLENNRLHPVQPNLCRLIFFQINCGTAAYRPITKCFTTVTWKKTWTIHRSKHCKRRVSWGWTGLANGKNSKHTGLENELEPHFISLEWNYLLSLSVPVADIKGLLTGKDCPHMKENKGKQNKVSSTPRLFRCWHLVGWHLTVSIYVLQEVLDLAFSITYDVEEYSLNFIAPSRTDVSFALN